MGTNLKTVVYGNDHKAFFEVIDVDAVKARKLEEKKQKELDNLRRSIVRKAMGKKSWRN